MYYCQDANIYEKVTSIISWNCPFAYIFTFLNAAWLVNIFCYGKNYLERFFENRTASCKFVSLIMTDILT